MTATVRELTDEIVRIAKSHWLDPSEASKRALKRALIERKKTLADPRAHCLEGCRSVGRECGIHKVCRRA